jgi:hypothetical protein
MHELLAELYQQKTPPHTVVVATNAPEDAMPERWEAQVRIFFILRAPPRCPKNISI